MINRNTDAFDAEINTLPASLNFLRFIRFWLAGISQSVEKSFQKSLPSIVSKTLGKTDSEVNDRSWSSEIEMF